MRVLVPAAIFTLALTSTALCQQPPTFAPYVGTWDYAGNVAGGGRQSGRLVVRQDGQCQATRVGARDEVAFVPCGFDGQGLQFKTVNSLGRDMYVVFRLTGGVPSGQISDQPSEVIEFLHRLLCA